MEGPRKRRQIRRSAAPSDKSYATKSKFAAAAAANEADAAADAAKETLTNTWSMLAARQKHCRIFIMAMSTDMGDGISCQRGRESPDPWPEFRPMNEFNEQTRGTRIKGLHSIPTARPTDPATSTFFCEHTRSYAV